MKTNICKIYENLSAFSADLKQSENDIFNGHYLASQNDGDRYKKFCLTADYNEANDLMYYGDKKALKRLTNAGTPDSINTTPTHRPRTVAARVGYAPHVANYLNGCPLNMLTRTRVSVPKRTLTIFYHIGCSGDTKASEIARTGANLLSAIKAIENNGVRVNLYVGKITEASKEIAATFVRVKTDGQPLDELKTAYFLANPSFFRRHLFRWWETTRLITDPDWRNGYGASLSEKADAEKFLENARVSYDKFVSFYSLRYYTANDILKQLTSN